MKIRDNNVREEMISLFMKVLSTLPIIVEI